MHSAGYVRVLSCIRLDRSLGQKAPLSDIWGSYFDCFCRYGLPVGWGTGLVLDLVHVRKEALLEGGRRLWIVLIKPIFLGTFNAQGSLVVSFDVVAKVCVCL